MPNVRTLVARLRDQATRPAVLARLGERHGAAAILILVPDPETGRPRPILGAAQTLPGSPRWRALLKGCRIPGGVEASVERPGGGPDLLVRSWTGEDGNVLMAIDPDDGCQPARLARLYGLAFALFRAEFSAELAAASAGVAQDIAEQSGRLLNALEGTRAQLARKAGALADALAEAERAYAALQQANVSLDAERRTAERAASTDTLTGVAARAAFEGMLAQAVAATDGAPLSLLLVDLDGFKEINDTRGHAAGDAILVAIGARLNAFCGTGMVAGRTGGDEFALILTGQNPEEAAAVAEQLQALVRVDVPLEREALSVRSTVGLASYPRDATSAADLLRKADIALYGAKHGNRGAMGQYSASVEMLFDERRQAIELLRCSLDAHRIMAYFQPKVSLRDGTVVGFEALARLRGEDGTIRGPADFWSALSDQESARRLGSRMLDLVIGELVACRAAGLPLSAVAINVSGPELSNTNFVRTMLDRLSVAGLSASLISIEITETAFLGDEPSRLRASLAALRQAGVSVALDDFGTGYSSLSHLLDWDVDCIKIDKSFVGELGRVERATKIVRSIVDLVRSLDLDVVAEGVETAEQAAYLRAIGCPLAQGYLFGRAAPAALTLRSRDVGGADAGASGATFSANSHEVV